MNARVALNLGLPVLCVVSGQSRGATVADIVNTVAITAIQAQDA